MALDPRLALGINNPTVTSTFRNILTNIGEQQRQEQSAELQPLRSQLLQAQASQEQTRALSERDKSRLTSLGNFANQVLPSLRSDDPQEALSQARSRLNRMQQTIADNPGIQLDTTETQEFISLLESGTPEGQLLATQRAEQAAQLAQSQGLLGRPQRVAPGQKGQARTVSRDGKLFSQQEIFNPNTNSIEVIETPIEGELVQRSTGLTSDQFVKRQVDIAGGTEEAELGQQLITKPLITGAVETAKLEPALRRETQQANIKRMSELQGGAKSRDASVKKASQFLRALKSGNAQSGATRSAASFVPGVFTSQAQFDERFNAFAEVAARQQLKAAGEIRPTDADVEGMKRAMFGVGRDEQTNIQLLGEFISAQQDQADELDDLKESRKNKTLDQFGAAIPQPQSLNSSALGRVVTEQEIQETLNDPENAGMNREQLFQQLGIQ